MHVPRARERVQICGRSGVFLVASIDVEQQRVDLIPLHGVSTFEQDIPFTKLEPYRENISQEPVEPGT